MFAAVFMETLPCRQRMAFRDLLAHPEGRTLARSRHSDKTCKTVSSRSTHRRHTIVAHQPCRARSDRRSVYPALARKICTPCSCAGPALRAS
ncbi:hypothetical protein PoB_003474000 [Plakobranchus ocellatus]|uniref:Uncharacterized protein n=1 Tax=Plakobranchus ocellatus TaxID=259542 RepID=A0AAV4AMV6_9GAST|nr:hypothetical protein PoB_003474000 [Plakobranchus ocellatus]